MTDDQPRNFKPLIYCALVIAVVAGAWLARPLYRNWKKQRYLAQAIAHLNQSDYKNAALSARQVRSLDPSNVGAARILAEISARLRSPEVIAWRQLIADLEPDNPTNHILLAEAALMFGESARAEQALVKIAPTNRTSPEFHQAAAMVLAGQHKLAEAEAHFAAAIKLAPTNDLLQLNHAVILMQARDTNVVAEGIVTLRKYAAAPAHRRMALQNLAQAYLHTKDFAQAVIAAKEAAATTNATFADQMLLLSVLRATNHPEFQSQLATSQTNAAAAGPEQVQSLVSWLLGTGQSEAALRWLTTLPEELQSQQRVSMALADLHLARADWPALQKLTESAKWAEADFLRHAMRSRACREQRQTTSADSAWLDAVRAAGGNPKMLATLARMAGAWGWTEEQENLLWTLVERHPGERWAPVALKAIYMKSADTRGLNRLAAALVTQNPNNLAAKNDLAGTALLLGTRTSRAHELAREVFTKFPSNEITASTYAYSLLVQGRRDDAVKAFAGVNRSALEQPSIALYYALVLGTNSPADARRYLDLAAKGKLLPEEKALLDNARNKL